MEKYFAVQLIEISENIIKGIVDYETWPEDEHCNQCGSVKNKGSIDFSVQKEALKHPMYILYKIGLREAKARGLYISETSVNDGYNFQPCSQWEFYRRFQFTTTL